MRVLRPVHPISAATQPRPVPNAVLAMLIFVVSETMLFAGLVSAFTIFRASAPLWPPPDQPRLPVEETALNTAALLFSGLMLFLARRCFWTDAQRTRLFLTLAMALGAFFVISQGFEWAALIREGLTLTSSALGSFFYLIVGLHALHAVVALGVLAYAWMRLQRGWLPPAMLGAAEVFWYFVVGIWPLLYWRVYL